MKAGPMMRFGIWLAAWYIRLCWATSRVRIHDPHNTKSLLASGQPVVVGFWHGQLMLSGVFAKWARRTPTALISYHKDGAMLSMAARHAGWTVISGSPKKGGRAAIKEMVALGNTQGTCLFITPDGPRGPKQQAKAGIVQISKLAQIPMIAIGLASSHNWRANSWDRMIIPRPFMTLEIEISAPQTVPATADDLEPHRQIFENTLNHQQDLAEARFPAPTRPQEAA